jgi:uncharacterized protein (TIGR03643 family)
MVEEQLICEYSGLPSVLSYMLEENSSRLNKSVQLESTFSDRDIDRIIQMAWEDRTPIEAITFQFGLREKDLIEFMRKHSLPSSFRMWRKRMSHRKTKHAALRDSGIKRFKCSRQKATGNKIAKRT